MPLTSSPRSSRHTGTSRVFGLFGGGSVLVATAGAAGLGALLAAASPAGAASFTVTNLNDSGAGSLRQAILDANAAATDDVIDFAPGLSGTISLSTGSMAISDEVTITGSGSANITISGGGTSQIFYIYDAEHVGALTVTISGLTLTNGYAATYGGGAIVSWGSDTTLRDVVITNSTTPGRGGAILHAFPASGQGRDARLTLEGCVISGNTASNIGGGVALYQSGGATITDTIFAGNTAGYAGGALSDELTTVSTTVTRSRISGNSAYLGGAMFVSGQDAAASLLLDAVSVVKNTTLYDSFGTVTFAATEGSMLILSSTIADNVGAGLSATNSRPFQIDHSTISGNSGTGVVGYSQTLAMNSSIVADNVAGDLDFPNSGFATVNWSLIESPGAFIGGDSSNNITGTDPALQPLLEFSNTAWVRPISNTSPAFNAGNPAFVAPPSTDQTGQARVAYGRIDMGAYELQEPKPTEPVVPAFTG